MMIDNLNLNLLRIFVSVYQRRNMTQAASDLHMTQSGVSQNIKHLEDVLQVNLFDRNKKILVPTHFAHQLFTSTNPALEGIEQTLSSMSKKEQVLKGLVHFAIPIEFGNNTILPLLGEFSQKHPLVQYKIRYGHAAHIESLIRSGEIDFAFVDSFSFAEKMHSEVVYEEKLELCCSQKYIDQIVETMGPVSNKKAFYEELDYLDYVEDGTLLCQWFKHHLGATPRAELRASLMDVQGISQLICHDLGVGILPQKVVEGLRLKGHRIFTFPGKGKPLLNPISLVSLEGRTLTKASSALEQFILSSFKKIR